MIVRVFGRGGKLFSQQKERAIFIRASSLGLGPKCLVGARPGLCCPPFVCTKRAGTLAHAARQKDQQQQLHALHAGRLRRFMPALRLLCAPCSRPSAAPRRAP